MIIDSIEVYRVAMPLKYPFRVAFGDFSVIESVLVKVTSGDQYGWGETTPFGHPSYCGEWAGGVFAIIKDFLTPHLLEKSIDSGEQLQNEMCIIKDNYFAKAGIDLAWWDLYCKMRNKPLWQVLGGDKEYVEVGADFGVMKTIDELIKAIDIAVKEGYKRIKLKYRPGWELDMIQAVRKEFPDTVFHIDCNAAYTLDDLKMFKKLDAFDLAMIEQPLAHNDLVDHSILQQSLKTPICLDESITSIDMARKAIDLKACGWINIKPGRVGGITNAIKIHNYCRDHEIPCWVGSMLESSLGASFLIALATLPNFKYPSDIFPSKRFYHEDLSQPEIVLSDPSQIKIPSGNGVGAEPNLYRLEKMKIDQC
jgi:O-succinylbenzoate synthase